MTQSLFQSFGLLHQTLSQSLAMIGAPETHAILGHLSRIPGLRRLEALEDLMRPEHLSGLLFHQDRYDAVAEALKFPADALRGIFGAEVRAGRLLPAQVGPHAWMHRETLRVARDLLNEGMRVVIDDWKASKIRRIFPRDSEPIQSWTTQRSFLVGSTRMIAEAYASIHEHPDQVEHFIAQLHVKITDWEGSYLGGGGIPDFLEKHLPGLQASRRGSFENRFEGIIPRAHYPWQAWLIMRSLAFVTTSNVFTRKKSDELMSFFPIAHRTLIDLLADLLSERERRA